jgi:hypothetical protein
MAVSRWAAFSEAAVCWAFSLLSWKLRQELRPTARAVAARTDRTGAALIAGS